MNKSALPMMAIGVALTGAALTVPMEAAHAACATSTALPLPITPTPIDDGSGAYGVGFNGRSLAQSSGLPSIASGLNRVKAQAVDNCDGECDPGAITESIGPSSIDTSCLLESYGAPITAQGLVRMRSQLEQALTRLAQLRTLTQHGKASSVYVLGGDQSRREGGDAQTGTPSLRIGRVDLTIGGDYRFSDQWVAGASVGLGNPRMRWSGNPDRIDGNSGNLTAYGSWSPSAASYVSAALSAENTHYMLRTDDGLGTTSTAFANGISLGLSLSAGYDLTLGNWTLSPYTRLDDISSRVSSFDSAGHASKGRTGSLSAGTQVQTTIPTSWGLIAPHARVELTQITGWHIQGDSARAFATGSNLQASPDPLRPDRQFGQFGIGASALFQRGLTVFTDYDQGFAQKGVSSWRFTVGVRTEL